MIRVPDMQRAPVHIRKDRYCPDSQVVTGPDNPDGDLSPIGDQHFVQHQFLSVHSLRRQDASANGFRSTGPGADALSSGGISPELIPIPPFQPTTAAWLARTESDASDNHMI